LAWFTLSVTLYDCQRYRSVQRYAAHVQCYNTAIVCI